MANALAEQGARVTRLDASPYFIEIARKDAASRGIDVTFVEGDMRAIPDAEELCFSYYQFHSQLSESAEADTTFGRKSGAKIYPT
jgi:2-polyprenyl-3-methyl-5-hydroxy-6-metoxy-1,4-benzoquinol methylase